MDEQIYSLNGMYPYPGNTSQPLNKKDNNDFNSVEETKQGLHYTPFSLSVGDAFTTYQQGLIYGARDPNNHTKTGLSTAEAEILKNIQDYGGIYYTHGLCRDTSLGGNDALNCYYGYNRDDDIAHPFHISKGNPNNPQVFMGRVYAERINALQSIMYLGFGIPKFNNMSGFWDNFYSKPLGEATQQGLFSKLKDMITFPASLPFRALRGAAQYYILIANGKIRAPITKYYAFQSQMPQYYLQVQSLLVQLATDMELIHGVNAIESSEEKNSAQIAAKEKPYAQGLKDHFNWMYGFGVNFFSLVLKKLSYSSGNDSLIQQARNYEWAQNLVQNKTVSATRQAAKVSYTGGVAAGVQGGVNLAKNQASLWNNTLFFWEKNDVNPFANIFGFAAREEFMFIGFKVERGANASDAVTTSTQPSPVQTKMNSLLYKFREGQFALMDNTKNDGVLGTIADALKGLASGVATGFGVGPLAAAASGFSNADIPEIWQDSRFSRSYSFNMEFVAGYGNPMSVFQDLYVPLCALLAGALPRSTGVGSYTSPFYVHAYCRGKFSIPMGMIDSISIDRGSSTHGWSHVHLPLSLNISFTIKDLTPSTPLAMMPVNFKGEITSLMDALATADSSLNQYLMVLAGLGPREILTPQLQVAARLSESLAILNDTFSPVNVFSNIGQWRVMRQLAKLLYKESSPLTKGHFSGSNDGGGE